MSHELIETLIHPKLIKFIFPNFPDSFECTNEFFIEDKTCIIIQDTFQERIAEKEKKIKVITLDDDFETIAKLPTILQTSNEETLLNEPKNDESKQEEKSIEQVSYELLFNDLKQFHEGMKMDITFLNSGDNEHLKSEKNLFDTFSDFASTCLKEYSSLTETYKNIKFLENARIYSKLLMGILYANNFCILPLQDFKKLKEFSLADMDDLKFLLKHFDITENEIIEIVSESHKKKYGLLLILFNMTSMRIEGLVWGDAWDQTKEKGFLKIEKIEKLESKIEEEEEEVGNFNALYIKALAFKRDNVLTNSLKALLHCLVFSEYQYKKFPFVIWKPTKQGEFPNLKEMIYFQNWFGYQPLFQIQEGIKKFPKQELLLEDYEKELCNNKSNNEYTSKFLKSRKVKQLEMAKKFKFIKDDFMGEWNDLQNKEIEIRLKKKECFSNLYLELLKYPKPSDFLGFFLLLKDIYQEKESMTFLETNLIL